MIPNQPRLAVLGTLVLAMLAFPALSANNKPGQSTPANKKLYCWDQNGQRTCSDALPAEAVDKAREEFNAKSGLRSGEVERTLSADERAAAAAAAAQRRLDEAAEQTRKRTDEAMLISYQSEDELRRVFSERIGIIDNNINTARYNVASLRDGLVSLLSTAGDRELSGQKLPDKLVKDIQQRHADLMAQQRLQTSFEQQRAALDGEIEQTLQRYRAMKGTTTPAATPQG